MVLITGVAWVAYGQAINLATALGMGPIIAGVVAGYWTCFQAARNPEARSQQAAFDTARDHSTLNSFSVSSGNRLLPTTWSAMLACQPM